jgi:hypothetical protein
MRSALLAPLAALLALAAAPALAQQAPPASARSHRPFGADADAAAPGVAVRLAYTPADGCPSEKELRDIVAARMGRDPFTPAGAAVPVAFLLRADIARQPGGFVATVELRDPGGRVLWSRPPLAEADCGRLVSVIGGLTVTIAIDSAATAAAAAAPAPPPPLPVPPSPSPAPSPLPPPVASWPSVRFGVRAAAAIGVGPAPAASLSADLGLGWQFFSIAVEGRADLPATGDGSMGSRLRTAVLAASLVPCGHYGWFFGCGVASAGVLRADGFNLLQAGQVVLGRPAADSGIYVAAGIRAGLEWPIVPAFALVLSGDLLLNAHPLGVRTNFPPSVGREEVWRSSPFAALIGGGLVVRFGRAPTIPK